jgi:hypothetical protein
MRAYARPMHASQRNIRQRCSSSSTTTLSENVTTCGRPTWTVTNSADLCDSFVVTYNMSSTEAPAGYEQKVKRAGQYKDSPPPAPKGWTYVAGVRTKSCLPQRRGPTARGLRVSATRDSNQSRFLQDNFTGDGLLAAVCCCIPGTLSVSPHTRNFAVARRSLV